MSEQRNQGHVVAGGAAALGRRVWAAPLLRGVLAVALGVLLLVAPELTVTWFLWVLGGFLVLDGVVALAGALRARSAVADGRAAEPWLWRLVLAVVSLAAGLVVLVAQDWTRSVLVMLLMWWALGTGVFGTIGALRQRSAQTPAWDWNLAAALVSLAFGLVLLARPDAPQELIATSVAAFALSLGVVLVVGAFATRGASAQPTTASG